MASDPGRAFAILTAFRGGISRDENLRRSSALAHDLRQLGYGFWVLGSWVEDGQRVSEDSFFVSIQVGTPRDKLAGDVLDLVRRYGQDAAVIGDAETIDLLLADGARTGVGEFSPGLVADAYSRLRGDERTFQLISARERGGFMNALLDQAARRNVLAESSPDPSASGDSPSPQRTAETRSLSPQP